MLIRNGPLIQIPFPVRRPVAAGDLVKQLTERLGIPQCGPCKKRQENLNRLLQFRPMRRF